MKVYSLFDKKLREFGPLVLANNDAAIVRAMQDGIPNSNSMMAKHPDDFDCMCIGSFDMETGVFAPEVPAPQLVTNLGVILLPSAQELTDGARR